MKKSIFVLTTLVFILLNLLLPSVHKASAADSSYAYVPTDGVYFYASDDERSELFLLPKTYYVRVLKKGDVFTKIEYLVDDAPYQKLVGYVKSERLEYIDYEPKTPYPRLEFTVEYVPLEGVNSDPLLTPISLSCYYYGEYTVGSKKYAYVLRGEDFAYVPLPKDFTCPLNDEHVNRQPIHSSSSQSDSAQTTADGGQIAVLILLAVLIPVLAALILKTPKRQAFEIDE